MATTATLAAQICLTTYTAKNVFTALTTNAVQFVNSNRGSVIGNHSTRVSSLYLEKKNYFPNFEEDLADHLQSLVIQEPDKDQVVQNLSFSIDNYVRHSRYRC